MVKTYSVRFSRGTERMTSFTMPVLQMLKKNNPDHNDTRVLVLTPTKETAFTDRRSL